VESDNDEDENDEVSDDENKTDEENEGEDKEDEDEDVVSWVGTCLFSDLLMCVLFLRFAINFRNLPSSACPGAISTYCG